MRSLLLLILTVLPVVSAQSIIASFSPQSKITKHTMSWDVQLCNPPTQSEVHFSSGFVMMAAQSKVPFISLLEANRRVALDLKNNHWTQAATAVGYLAEVIGTNGVAGYIKMSKSTILSALGTASTARTVGSWLQSREPVNPIAAFGNAVLAGSYSITSGDCSEIIMFSDNIKNPTAFRLEIGVPAPKTAALAVPMTTPAASDRPLPPVMGGVKPTPTGGK
jgi:hypothetical protein